MHKSELEQLMKYGAIETPHIEDTPDRRLSAMMASEIEKAKEVIKAASEAALEGIKSSKGFMTSEEAERKLSAMHGELAKTYEDKLSNEMKTFAEQKEEVERKLSAVQESLKDMTTKYDDLIKGRGE